MAMSNLSNNAKFLAEADPILAKVIHTIPQPVVYSSGNLFMDLMSCVIEQQIHYRSTKKVFQGLLDKAEIKNLSPANFEIFEEKGLATIAISGKKMEAIVGLIELFADTSIDWKQQEELELRKLLAQQKGIGPVTIDMVCLYTYGFSDVFPAGDFHLKEIMTKAYTLNPKLKLKKQLLEVAQHWQPYRSLAVKYWLAWKDYEKARK